MIVKPDQLRAKSKRHEAKAIKLLSQYTPARASEALRYGESHGWSPNEVHALLAAMNRRQQPEPPPSVQHESPPPPQPLGPLINPTMRRIESIFFALLVALAFFGAFSFGYYLLR